MTPPMTDLGAEAPSHDVAKLGEWARAAAAEEVSHTYAAKMREVSDALEASAREVAELRELVASMQDNDGEIAAAIERAGMTAGTWIVHALDQACEQWERFAEAAATAERQRDEAMAAHQESSRQWRSQFESMHQRAMLAERALRERDEALKPFAVAADIRLCGGDHWTDEKRIQGTDIAFHITFGDLRRALRVLATPTASDPAREGR